MKSPHPTLPHLGKEQVFTRTGTNENNRQQSDHAARTGLPRFARNDDLFAKIYVIARL